MKRLRFAATATVLILGGCAGSGGAGLPVTEGGLAHPLSTSSVISHVVIVVQENRSFDNLFATFPGADGATAGLEHFPFGDKKIPLNPGPLEFDDFGHGYAEYVKEYDGGKMDSFNLAWRVAPHGKELAGTYIYRYVAPKHVLPYWALAKQYVLADHMFSTQGSSSFVGHQALIAGGEPVSGGDYVIDYPSPATWGCNGPSGTVTSLITSQNKYLLNVGPYPCFVYPTMRDLLDAKGLSWRYFTNASPGFVWNAFDAIAAVHDGPEWKTNIERPEKKFFDYVSGGELPNVSWVVPDAANSDHPGYSDFGPSWVASIVNAIGESKYWDSTAIIVVWDDWGGEYDHVAPPQMGWGGLGMRVPMLVVSAYAREQHPGEPGYISHTQYEFGSILRFIEDLWSLGRLGSTDQRAKSIGNCFNFKQPPRPFEAIPAKYSKQFFEHQRPSGLPLDTE